MSRLDGKANDSSGRGMGTLASVAADVCNDAGGSRWCSGCLAAHGAWNAACPRCWRALEAIPRLSRIKREAA
jgi:hypothetical protein